MNNFYSEWHEHPKHEHAHWGVFLAACLVIANLLIVRINDDYQIDFSTTKVEAQTTLPLIQQNNLTYLGAFRVPQELDQTRTFAYGGTALTYWPAHNSLLLVGHDWHQQVGEISIPTPSTASTISGLPRSTFIQPLTDILAGKRLTIDGDTANGVKIGGIIPLANRLVVTAWSFYDGNGAQTKSHFLTGHNFATLQPSDVTGPFQVGTGFSSNTIAGFVSGYMSTIPNVFQASLGGTHLTGQGGQISIISRTSSGPSATVFSPSDLGVTIPAPGIKVMGYPYNHPTLGTWGVQGSGLGLYNGTQGFRGMVFPDGTQSILFFGWGSDNFCYGVGTTDPALDRQPVVGSPGVIYCYDLTPGAANNKGTHGYPVSSIVYAYNVNDFIAVKNGTKQPWEVVPYSTWKFSLPFQSNMVNGLESGAFEITGAAYDPATQRIFVSAFKQDNVNGYGLPLIHVFQINNGTPVPTPTPTPAPTPVPAPTPAPSATSISVTLNPSSIAAGSTSQATAKDQNGNTLLNVAWSVEHPDLATVTSSGLITGKLSGAWASRSQGATAVIATLNGVKGNAFLTITAPSPTPSPTPTPTPIVGDLNLDGIVNSLDWSLMNTKWFTADAAADLNHDGIVNSIDFSIMNNNWLKTS